MSIAASDPSAMSESFGPRLRRERERRQIALASIADNTKISVSLFEDLERDDISRWPSGIYRRSFIRAYAAAIGLDADATAREFLERFPDPNAPAAAAPPPSGSIAAGGASPASTLRLTLADPGPSSFVGGRILTSARGRCAAVACDAAVVAVLGAAMYLVLGTLWMPLAIALAGYYTVGILLLGNTPGVCLCAPGNRTNVPTNRQKRARSTRVEAAAILAALRTARREWGNALAGRSVTRRQSAPPTSANSTVPS